MGFKARAVCETLSDESKVHNVIAEQDDGTLLTFGCMTWSSAEALAQLLNEDVGFITVDETPSAAGEDLSEQDTCSHEWIHTGTAYGGEDESYRGEGRVYCSKCGADGDA